MKLSLIYVSLVLFSSYAFAGSKGLSILDGRAEQSQSIKLAQSSPRSGRAATTQTPGPKAKVYRAGLGVILGTVTGISGNYRLTKTKSIDGALSFSLKESSEFTLYSTYLWHRPGSLMVDDIPFGWYLGLGVQAESYKDGRDTEIKAGPRGSVGLHFPISRHRFDIFLEGALVMNIVPETDVDGHIGLGGRIYF